MLDVSNKASSTAAAIGRPLIRIQNNAQINTEKQAEAAAARAEADQLKPENQGLMAYLKKLWSDAKTYRAETGIGDQMIKSLRQRKGEYESDVAADINEQGGTDVFMGLTDVKCRAAEAWIHDVLNADNDKSWKIKPSPDPELPPELEEGIVNKTMETLAQHIAEGGEAVELDDIYEFAAEMRGVIEEKIMEEATERADRMEVIMHDQLMEGKWKGVFEDFVSNLVTLKAGFIKGPIVRRKRKLNWVTKDGRTAPQTTWELCVDYEAPSPFDMYESRGGVDIDDGTLIERMKLNGFELEGLKNVDGYDGAAIDLCLFEYRQGGLRTWTEQDSDRQDLEDKGTDTSFHPDCIEALEYWTRVQGKMLLEEGVTKAPDGEPIKPLEEYHLNCIRVGDYCIYKAINDDPLGRRPYSKTGWAKVPGSFWYRGVPELMEDLQRICNASIRAMVNNQGMASGPQFVYSDIGRLPPGEPVSQSYPGRVHQFNNLGLSNEKPFYTVDIPSHAQELMGVYTHFSNLADEYTGIPAYEHGQGTHVGGAGRTLGGLSMLMTNAARGIKLVIMRIDNDVLRTSLTRQYEFNMIYHPDESIKGDVEIVAQGTLAKIIKEQLMQRRSEFLNVTNNPVDMQLLGLGGRAQVLRETARALDLSKDIVKTNEEIRALENMQQVMEQRAMEEQLQPDNGQASAA